MPVIKVNNSGVIANKEKVDAFISRVYNIREKLEAEDCNETSLYELIEKIKQNKYYDSKMVWYIESLEDNYKICVEGQNDLPF